MKNKKNVISFDFDNTIAITYIDFEQNKEPKPVFLEYNQGIIDKINEHISNKDEVFIVTSRYRHLEEEYPDQDVPYHLNKLGLTEYFWPDRVFYMNGGLKIEKLKELNVDLHYDDSMEELLECKKHGVPYKSPYDYYKDAAVAGKSVIYDADDNILVLKRGDEGTKWDFPGGHIKEIELQRGEFGLQKGLEREVAEETGIILPNEQYYFDFSNTFNNITNQIHVYLTKLINRKPEIDLNVQQKQENIAYEWVPLSKITQYLDNSTSVFETVVKKLLDDNKTITNEGQYLATQHKNWRKMKTKLIGMGKNTHKGGGKGHEEADMGPSKNVLALEEQNSKKKQKIKVKIIKNEQNLDEKKKKRRKKRKKQASRAKTGGYYPYYDLYDGDSGGFGDGGGGE